MKHKDSFHFFVMLHTDLLKELFKVDLLFLLCSVWYIGISLPEAVEPFRAGVLVSLLMLVFTFINMHVVSAYIGAPEFYRMLPVHRITFLIKSHLLLLAPFFTALYLILLLIFGLTFVFELDMVNVIFRTTQIFLIFCIIKLLTLPTLLIMRKSMLLLCAFYLLQIPLLLVVTICGNSLWSRTPFSLIWSMLTYVLMLLIVEVVVVSKCK